MNKSAIVVAAALVVVVAAGAGYWFGAQRLPAASGGPTATGAVDKARVAAAGAPTTVEATKVATQAMPQTITTVGSLRSDESVTIRPEVAGRISAILFKEG